MGHRPRRFHTLEFHRDRRGFGLSDPDRQRHGLGLIDQQHDRVHLLIERDSADLHVNHDHPPRRGPIINTILYSVKRRGGYLPYTHSRYAVAGSPIRGACNNCVTPDSPCLHQGLHVERRNNTGMIMSTLRLVPALILGKATAVASRALRLGGGTTMPGRVARAVAPDILPRLAARLPQGCVVVTGTNGKTTTSRLMHHILRLAGLVSVHNRAGANLAAGIVTALVQHADW